MKLSSTLTFLSAILSISFGAKAYDYDTTGYATVSEVKSFSTHIDVYLSDGQTHINAAASIRIQDL